MTTKMALLIIIRVDCIIIRVEDAMLSEMPGLLKEYFGKQHGFLPEGSMLMFGSLSHLALRGLEHYSEECVKIFKAFTNMLPNTCSVTHLVFAPLGDVAGPGLIRDLYDLDSWLRSAGTGMPSLPQSRKKFWDILLSRDDADTTPDPGSMGSRILYMPESLKNSARIRTVSHTPHATLPAKLAGLSEPEEKILIESIMNEINEMYAINVDPEPVLARSSGSSGLAGRHSGQKIVVIGASHAKRIAGGLVSSDFDTIDLTRPGWVADPQSISEIAEKLDRYGIESDDFVIVDALSNSCFKGTDPDGNQIPPYKDTTSGKWHIPGELNLATKPALKKILLSGKQTRQQLCGSGLLN
jgi:hypothetical protein